MKMVKIQKEIWVEQCDFCDEKKKTVCSICGKDICGLHALTLDTSYYKESGSSMMFLPPALTVIHSFCPDHLSEELLQYLNDKVHSLSEKAKEGGEE